MRVALLSDVHANLAALDAILAHAESAAVDAFWHTGDLVGYGPDPDAVVRRIVELDAKCVLGNHDAAVAGLADIEGFNEFAAAGCRWTVANSSYDTRSYLATLPRTEIEGDYTRVHGSLRDPIWEYLATQEAAVAHFSLQETAFSVFGHTHLPMLLYESAVGVIEAFQPGDGDLVELAELRCAINPGSGGQPRDGDPRACYAMLDTAAGTVIFHRVAYDIAITQQRITEAGLPGMLARRLALGR